MSVLWPADHFECPSIRQQLEGLLDGFEAELKEGRAPNLDSYLDQAPSLVRVDLLRELFALELAYRERRRPSNATFDNEPAEATAARNGHPVLEHEGALRVRCPHCHQGVEFARLDIRARIECCHCGNGFRLLNEDGPDDAALCAGAAFGHFQLERRLGAGRFGQVWLARDIELDRRVAIKVPHAAELGLEEEERFVRESQAAATLKHPNIVAVYDIGRVDGRLYLVTEYVAGESLAERLALGPFSACEAARLCAQLAEAVQHAHDHGVIHRDLSPSNILLDGCGEPHVADFGLARRSQFDPTITLEGNVFGTPAYMSPEQARGEPRLVDCRADVYAIGAILYRMLTGALPFEGNARRTLHQAVHDAPRRPRLLNDCVPRDLESICLKAMEKEPSWRYQSAAELAADLGRFLNGQGVLASPRGWFGRSWLWCRRPARITEAGLVLQTIAGLQIAWILLGIVGGYFFAPPGALRAELLRRLLTRALVGKGLAVFLGYWTMRQNRLALWVALALQTLTLVVLIGHFTGHFQAWNVYMQGASPEFRFRQWTAITCMMVFPWLWYVMAALASIANPASGRARTK